MTTDIIQNQHQLNYTLLKNALEQCGPYQGQTIYISTSWLLNALEEKIKQMDWPAVVSDVRKFLPNELLHITDNWNNSLFLAMLKKLGSYLN